MYQNEFAFQRKRYAARATLYGGHEKFRSRALKLSVMLIVSTAGFASAAVQASVAEDRQTLANLDTKYQKAVEQNDAKTMTEILADDFVLVEGDGKRSTKADLVNDAKSGKTHYVHQDDSDRAIEFGGWRAAECKLLRVWNVTNSSGVCQDRGAPWKRALFPGQKSRFGSQFFHCGGQGRFVVTFGVPDQIRSTGFRLMEERRFQCRPATAPHLPRLLIS